MEHVAGAVHVVDDDAAIRDSLAALLGAAGFLVKEYESASAFLTALEDTAAGCVVTDVRMPEISGLELLRRLGARQAHLPTIVLTGAADVQMAVEALKSGAVDFIEKPFEPATILAAVGAAMRRSAKDDGLARQRESHVQGLAGLSAREQDVLDGLLSGRSNKEIARDLGISPRTVEAYRAKLMIKMEADSLPELVRIAMSANEGVTTPRQA